jgi:hypothetical protein
LEEKESVKWVEGIHAVQRALPESVGALLIMDREADIYAVLAAPRRAGVDLLVRAAQPRRVEVVQRGGSRTLWEAVAQSQALGERTVHVHPRPDRAGRDAVLTLRQVCVDVLAPRQGGTATKKRVRVWVVAAKEENPPEGVKEPLEWILVTSLPTATSQQAWERIETYAKRWQIERFHFVLKSGCRFERLQVDTVAALHKALSLYSVVAWRLLHVLHLSREAPQTPADQIVSPTERQVLEAALERPVTTAAEVVLAVAQIGGFRPVPSAPLPGVQSLWLGLRKLEAMVEGYLLARRILQRSPP